jgi:hypothetical protein
MVTTLGVGGKRMHNQTVVIVEAAAAVDVL